MLKGCGVVMFKCYAIVVLLSWSACAVAEVSSENRAAAHLSVQLSAMETYVRELQGQLEVLQHDIQNLRDQQSRQGADYDGRFKTLEDRVEGLSADLKAQHNKKTKSSSEKKPSPSTEAKPVQADTVVDAKKPQKLSPPSGTAASSTDQQVSTDTGADVDESEVPKGASKDPAKVFKRARTLFDQSRYAEAESLFSSFIQSYPKHKNAHQAHFYLGSIRYVGGEFPQASLDLVQAYKADPKGDKAQESLLKLALCLQKMSKKAEACKTLNKLTQAFPNMSPSVKKQSMQLNQKLACVSPSGE